MTFWTMVRPIPGSPGAGELVVDATDWAGVARSVAAAGGLLISLWATPSDAEGNGAGIRAAFLIDGKVLVATLPVPDATRPYCGLQELFPAAGECSVRRLT
jgi:hypothetical protein